jgi:RNA polymerase sigma-70 factor (ECF subfamily)
VPGKRGRFPSTRWTLVLELAGEPSPEAEQALATLCQAYWYPLYAFLRGGGHDRDEAADLTQAFFLHVLEKRTLARADPARGRFRSFLLASLKNFVANEHDRSVARKRGGAMRPLSFDLETAEGLIQREPATDETPERVFDRRWANALLSRALMALEEEMSLGKHEQFNLLKEYLTGDAAGRSYAEVATRLGMSEGAVKVAVHRLRRRFREIVKTEIAHTVAAPEEVPDEIRYLLSAVGR